MYVMCATHSEFNEIKVRLEIGILMFNYAAVKNWMRLVAWFSSYGVKCLADTEHNVLRNLRNVYVLH